MPVDLHITDDFPPATKQTWREKAEKDLRGTPLEKLVTHTIEGLDIDPLYTRDDAVAPDARGFPGMAPFVRGREVVERATRGWQVCQEHGQPGLEACGVAIERDLARGAGAVWVRLGLAQGTRLLTMGDLDRLLRAVKLAETPLYLDPGPDAVPVAAALAGVARARGVSLDALRGGFGCDPLGTLAREGTLSNGLGGAFRDLTELAAWAGDNAPHVRPLLVSTLPYHGAGATAVQELAWAIATGVEYLRRLVQAGASVDEAAQRIVFRVGVGGDFFMEVAKLRAARWLWSKAVAASGGSERAQAMLLHARTSPWTKSQRDPWVNILRATAESFAAAVGGADAVGTSAFDEAIGPSDDFACRVARNTQLVLREEAHLHRVIDPAGGSWYVESLTERLARTAWDAFRDVEREGGMVRALGDGRVRRALDEASSQRLKDIATRRAPFVGVSEYPNLQETPVERSHAPLPDESPLGRGLPDGDDAARRDRLQTLADITVGRRRVEPGQLMASLVDAAAEGVDLFRLGDALRRGKPSRHVEPLQPWRGPEPWEALRDASDAYQKSHARRPRVFLANLGAIPEHRARAEFAHNLFSAGGIEPVTNDGFDSVDAAVAAFGEADADLAVICGPDERYPDVVPTLAAALKDAGATAVVLAGKPGDRDAAYREAGVDRFVHVGADVLAILKELHREIGVKP
ncbi:MAG: methylmalonyl-CoA mutase family protein [Myxococcota bacterium]